MLANLLKNIPANNVMAVIDGKAAAFEALVELHKEGFTDAAVFEGEESTEQVEAKTEHTGPVETAVKAAGEHLSEESSYLAQYQEEARLGKQIISVPVANHDAAAQVQEALAKHGARNIRFFGRLAVTDLTPESNPSGPPGPA
jgi:hypothetical protein